MAGNSSGSVCVSSVGIFACVQEKYRLQSVHVPREVVWLNGAPGAGKVCAMVKRVQSCRAGEA